MAQKARQGRVLAGNSDLDDPSGRLTAEWDSRIIKCHADDGQSRLADPGSVEFRQAENGCKLCHMSHTNLLLRADYDLHFFIIRSGLRLQSERLLGVQGQKPEKPRQLILLPSVVMLSISSMTKLISLDDIPLISPALLPRAIPEFVAVYRDMSARVARVNHLTHVIGASEPELKSIATVC